MKKSKIYRVVSMAILFTAAWFIAGCGDSQKKTEMELTEFIKTFEAKFAPLYKDACLASWDANVTGKEEFYAKSAELEFKISQIFSNTADFDKLKKIKESGKVADELLKRQLTILYNAYLSKQVDTALTRKMIDQQTAIAQKFNTFRAVVGKDSLTDNQVEEILRTSTDSKQLEAVWNASKLSGQNVAADVIALVKLRNEAAKKLGFANYHEMSLKLGEQDPAEVEALFDELDSLTRDAFGQLKGEIDEYLSGRFKIPAGQLMPWHYQNRFFQEAPAIYSVELDVYYKDKDIVKVTEDYYKGIGMDITDMLKNSSLYEQKGKNQHAFCIDIDKQGDVRVLCNVKNNSYWMNTMLHEYGHAVYQKYIDRELPYLLRDPAHTFTTEAVAMFFGRLSSNPNWMKTMLGVSPEEAAKIAEDCYRTLRLEQLVFSRWSQVMYRFEKGMYENPDQDLNKLWWTLVEKYQGMKAPAGRNQADWASKIHIATSPCYYHNYLMGEIFASQMTYYIAKNLYKTDDIRSLDFAGNPELGKFMLDNVFKPGMKYEWNDMISKATGEKLTARYYAKQFVN